MGYGFTYDTNGRLEQANYGSGTNLTDNLGRYNESYAYDDNSNITQLIRNGKNGETTAIIDSLKYSYIGNQLNNVTDLGIGTLGFKDVTGSSREYAYDANGNLTADANRGVDSITYNALNLPQVVITSTSTYTFTYSASGEKLKVAQTGSITKTLTYEGPLTLEGDSLMSIATPEGRLNNNGSGGYKQEYTITDNQGNVRVTFERGTDGKVKLNDERHYYPSGLVFMHGENSAVNHFGYGGKEELGDELGWLDFHARMYDPSIGRWHTPDPLAEEYYSSTPYGYCSGDPVNFIDPTGMNEARFNDLETAELLYYLSQGIHLDMAINMVKSYIAQGGVGGGGGKVASGDYSSYFDTWNNRIGIYIANLVADALARTAFSDH